MSVFTLAISCLTTSNLLLFMDLTFQVAMQYCSLHHWTLLLSPSTSTAGCCSWFASVSSFLLELFLHSFLVADGHLWTWGVHLSVSCLLAFSYCSWGSQGKNTECFVLETTKDHSVIFVIAPKYCTSDSFVDYEGYCISSRGRRYNGHLNLNPPIQVHFSSLIPKMSVFTLAISCLTTSNFPWFMDLTFQVPMQYYFYSIGLYFHHESHLWLGIVFALAQPFILSGVISPLFSRSILGTYRPGEFIFQCPIFLPFHTVHWVLKARRLKWFSISFSSGPYFVFMELAILKHHINRSIQFVPLHVGLLWLSIVFSRYIHIVACGRMTFFFVAE